MARKSSKIRNGARSAVVAESLEGRQLLSAAAVGLQTNDRVIQFDVDNPGVILSDRAITGLRAGESLLGIDHRPSDLNPSDGVNRVGQIYGVTSQSRVVTLNPSTGAATVVSTLFTDTNGNGQRDDGENLNIRFSESGLDFNPTVDRLRLVNGRDENYRINVDTGLTIIDGTLAYDPMDVAAGRNPRVTGSAYINSDANPATGTVLYGLDTDANTLVEQNPANAGRLKTVGALRTAAGPVESGFRSGFDVLTLADGFNVGYASITIGSSPNSSLYEVDLTNGAMRSNGIIGGSADPRSLRALTIRPGSGDLDGPRDAASALAVGLQTDNRLIRFDAANPSVIFSDSAITGLRAGELVVGIDYRPSDLNAADGVNRIGTLYGVTSESRIITLDASTGAATVVAALYTDTNANGQRDDGENLNVRFSESGVNFNPTVDRLRLVNGRDENYRINVDTGLTIIDGPLVYGPTDSAAGRNPRVTAAAYINNDADPRTGTALYDLDTDANTLVEQVPANAGTLTTEGQLRTSDGPLEAGAISGLDVLTRADGFNVGYAALTIGGSPITQLYEIDIVSGALRSNGVVGGAASLILQNRTLRDVSIVLGSGDDGRFSSTPIDA
ncbi:MAG TPA: DUF4394 domain-containing protein [Tepidisphaeraceae bacterium]|jgi:hypothetical protein|nr:DUF4394 domain-containing protein [Tepidisphaeraceae bacterium]